MRILKGIQRIPGGMMIVPLLIAAIIHTFAPKALEIGSFTSAIFSSKGLDAMIGLQLFFVGTRLKLRQAPEALKRGIVLLIAKYAAGALFGLLIAKIFGLGGIIGISVLAIISTMTGANGGLYLSLIGTYGDTEDAAAMSLLNIHDGPFLTMLTLGVTGLAHIPLINLVAAIVPLVVGAILGNLDDDFQKLFSPGLPIVIPFIGFTIGGGIDLGSILKAGINGIILALLVVVIGGGITVLADKYILRRPGYAGTALASSSGNSIANPAVIASIDAAYKPFVSAATAEIASAVVLTAIFVPLLTAFMAKKFGSGRVEVDNTVSSNQEVELASNWMSPK
ncbi:2-keto-3-deoxygluconate permease [Alicyclobacillus fastidiosus]|uniref:2-keto-3-deoxygluconate permease n=1 Tax=Alicyclobacillus fastidiosus TaxID=392011 RepID=A0ABY6ZKS1_9BACL|nr:2-keto-3-deoxygluconate permease [Alicyclobacillus fastidiosus]WAH43072.1 2-keto-3-deoxygluconate permease [Alicyclobacillus fastidiosus]GMA65060.1 2-keto-3-deoxygluconate permease [Alicyclobacillus fastidiosus]